jgi:hypothetical protein
MYIYKTASKLGFTVKYWNKSNRYLYFSRFFLIKNEERASVDEHSSVEKNQKNYLPKPWILAAVRFIG